MKTPLPVETSSPITVLKAPILTKPRLLGLKAVPIPIAFTSAQPTGLAIHGQPQDYFIPSSRPLWQNPLNDF
jgi:hypothetical protein